MILDNYLRSGFTFDENEDYLEFQIGYIRIKRGKVL